MAAENFDLEVNRIVALFPELKRLRQDGQYTALTAAIDTIQAAVLALETRVTDAGTGTAITKI
jgi:hypothetical protein